MDVVVELVKSGLVKMRLIEHARPDFDPALRCRHAVAVRRNGDSGPGASDSQGDDTPETENDEVPLETAHAASPTL